MRENVVSTQGKSLIGCNSMIEKSNFVATGTISYLEGDIIEIKLSQYKVYNLGDQVKLVIYALDGLLNFLTTVVAIDHGAIMLITPPKLQEGFLKQREHPRIQVNRQGRIHSLTYTTSNETLHFENPPEMKISNISLGGLGFILTDELSVNVKEDCVIVVELKIESSFSSSLSVIRKQNLQQGVSYGAKFIDLTKEKVNTLRAVILRQQVEQRFQQKKKEINFDK